MNAWLCVLVTVIGIVAAALLWDSLRIAAGTPKADPDLTDYQQKFLDDEGKRRD
jgi:hypothetical protein